MLLKLLSEYHTLPELDLPTVDRSRSLVLSEEDGVLQPESSDPLRFIPVGRDAETGDLFYLADREITKGWYARFLQNNPSWNLSSKEDLIARFYDRQKEELSADRMLLEKTGGVSFMKPRD